jgi:HEAT repeat protein
MDNSEDEDPSVGYSGIITHRGNVDICPDVGSGGRDGRTSVVPPVDNHEGGSRLRLVGPMPLDRLLLGEPSTLDGPRLARGVRRGSEPFAAACARWIGERPEPEAAAFLRTLVHAPSPAVRHAALWGLAWRGAAADRPLFEAAWADDLTEEGRLAIAVGRAHCGADPAGIRATLAAHEQRTLLTPLGPRTPALTTGAGSLVERYDLLMTALEGGEGAPSARRASALDARRRAFAHRAADRMNMLALAILRHPADSTLLTSAIQTSGRREEHDLFLAIGWSGAPEAADLLRDALRATDVDPGRGFAQRRMGATALGRLGLRHAIPWLLRALEDEVHDYEGRPGAGLGIQYPVRTNLIWALGEVGDVSVIPALTRHLADTHGSAFGGFYLAAMDALWKLGAVARPALTTLVAEAPEIPAAHALGVLHAGGTDISAWRTDPRPAVRQVVTLAAGGQP